MDSGDIEIEGARGAMLMMAMMILSGYFSTIIFILEWENKIYSKVISRLVTVNLADVEIATGCEMRKIENSLSIHWRLGDEVRAEF